MLEFDKRATATGMQSERASKPFYELFESALGIFRRQLPIVIVVFACCLALGALYYFTATPMFTATGTLLLDTRKVQLLEKQSVLGDIQLDASVVQTQVEVLKSETISLAVIRKLHLTEDPEFVGDDSGLLAKVMGFVASVTGLGSSAPATDSEREKIALETFARQLSVVRLGLTYVMEVSFTSDDPAKSARIVNAVVDSYLGEQMDSKYQAARRAGIWLLERIKELRAQSTAADRAVVEFKEKNNIVDTGGGKLMSEQQVSEINSQMIIARAGAAEAKARLERIQAVMSSPNIADAAVSDVLKNEVIIKVRNQYLDLAQREAIFAQKYGSNHLATVNLRTQMQELKRNIADEMRKIAESYKSDYEIALAREKSLKESLAAVVSEAQVGGQAQVQLRELEANKQTAKAIYDSFLQRYMEAAQQQDSMPISETRLISPATPPLKKSSPKGSITLLVAVALGGVLGFGVAFLRDAADSVLRTTDQIESNLHVACLAMVPAIKTSAASRPGKLAGSDDTDMPAALPPADSPGLLRHVVDSPFSRFAESIRSIKIAADVNGALKSHRIIGITSTLPNEGKTSIASNLAHLIADAGARAVLVDADLRSPSLSSKLDPGAVGLVDVVLGTISLESALVTLPSSSGLAFLGAGSSAKLVHTNEILASAGMKKLMEGLRAQYDYIIVDLSPIAPIVDVRATGHIIDTYVFVAEWGKTKLEVIERALTEAHNVYDQLLGVVLNKVDMSAQSRYERYHGDHYYKKYYSKYGYVE